MENFNLEADEAATGFNVNRIKLKDILVGARGLTSKTEDGRFVGIRLNFEPEFEDKIHYTSVGGIVQVFPKPLSIDLDMDSVVAMYGAFIETLSSYLHQIRSEVLERDYIVNINSSIESNYLIRIRVSKYFFREGDKARSKISFAFISKESGNEVINISFSKRDVQVLAALFRTISSTYDRDYGIHIPGDLSGDLSSEISVVRIDNSIMIGGIWLHGQEVSSIQSITHDLVNKLGVEENLSMLRTKYRQIEISEKEGVLYLNLHKYEDESVSVSVPLTQKLLSILSLYADIGILSKIPASEFEDGTLNSSLHGSTDRIQSSLSMQESSLGIAIRDKKNSPKKKFMFLGTANPNAFMSDVEGEESLDGFIKHHSEDGEVQYIELLREFSIDLKGFWVKLLRGLSFAYTEEYLKYRVKNHFMFFVINNDQFGRWKYQFKIVSDPANKAPAVLIIEKYKVKMGEDEILVSKYRQPLFRKYLHQLISMILGAASEMTSIKISNEINAKELMKYSYKSFSRVAEVKRASVLDFGIRKAPDGTVTFGALDNPKLSVNLSENDKVLLRITSEFRILNGYWLPVVSDKIAISQDGYLNDMFSEVNLEEFEGGVDWAASLFFGVTT